MNTPHTLTPDLLRSTFASDLMTAAEKLDVLADCIIQTVPRAIRLMRADTLMRDVSCGLILTDNDGMPTGELANDEQAQAFIDANVHHAIWACETHVRVSADRRVAATYGDRS